jgi:pyridoxal phosphate-dependent aminotransferase EpsN
MQDDSLPRIHLSVPHMGGKELDRVGQAFESNWLSSVGPQLNEFERRMEERLGRPCVALASGTAAIHLGLRLLGVSPGDEVICPSLTFAASVNPVVYLGAEPVFVDSERASWNLDPASLEEALEARHGLGRKVRAVIVVHLFGQTADMEAIRGVCQRWDVPILEDAAEALGADYRGTPAGALGEVAALSFNGNKIITTTGGGMLVAEDPEAIEKARFWSTQARDPGVAYSHSELGYNYRMSNVLAAIGVEQLAVLDDRVAQRRAVAEGYVSAFAERGLRGIELMPDAGWGMHNRWLSTFTVDEEELGCSSADLLEALAAQNIDARPVWKPMHLQPLYREQPVYGGAVAEDLFARGICLPSSSSLSADEQQRVVRTIVERAT